MEIPSPIFIREIWACVSIGFIKFEFAATIMELECLYKYIAGIYTSINATMYKSFIFE
jgi:hypothetical protein